MEENIYIKKPNLFQQGQINSLINIIFKIIEKEQDRRIPSDFWQKIENQAILILSTILNLIICCSILYPIFIVLSFLSIFQHLFKSEFQFILTTFIVLLSCLATLFILFMSYVYYDIETYEKYQYYDALIFYITTMLVVSYIKVVQQQTEIMVISKQPELNSICDVFKPDILINMKLISTIFHVKLFDKTDQFYSIDLETERTVRWKSLYENEMKKIKVSYDTQKFDYLNINKIPTILDMQGEKILTSDDKKSKETIIYPFLGLVLVVIVKTFMILIYSSKQEDLDAETVQSLAITTLFYIYTTWILNKALGSYDLKKKTHQMYRLNDIINYREKDLTKYYGKKDNDDNDDRNIKLLDITSATSLETWDNARKFVCSLFIDKLYSLENTYICVFFYYVFVTLICIAAYGEFTWMVSKDSIYNKPLMVIQYSIDFVFLNLVLMFRLWEGQKYNDSFEDIKGNISYLLDATEDMQQMFDHLFYPQENLKLLEKNKLKKGKSLKVDLTASIVLEQNNNNNNPKIENIYKVFIDRINFISNYYMDNKLYYQGNLYEKGNSDKKKLLQKKILKNMRNGLIRIQTSNLHNQNDYCYKFLNFFKIDFSQFLTTSVIAIISVLPNILPKLIDFYEPIKQPKPK